MQRVNRPTYEVVYKKNGREERKKEGRERRRKKGKEKKFALTLIKPLGLTTNYINCRKESTMLKDPEGTQSTMFLKLQLHGNHLESFWGLDNSDSLGLGWDLRFCISNKIPFYRDQI